MISLSTIISKKLSDINFTGKICMAYVTVNLKVNFVNNQLVKL